MTASSIPSFSRPDRFSFILRGRKVILGHVDDLQEGDLRVCGSLTRGFFQILRYTKDLHTVLLGGRWAQRFHYTRLTYEEIERVECALMRLSVRDWFIFVAAEMAMTLSAPEPVRPVAEFMQRLMGKPKSQKKGHSSKRKCPRDFSHFAAA